MLELFGLRQDYGDRCVLDIPSLTLHKGEHYALIGANGAGKTTLLRALIPRLKITSDPSALGYLPQKPYAFAMSVRQNIELGIPVASELSRAEKQAYIDRQLSDFGLEARAHQRADNLSGGEAQKMALARLCVVPRQVLLLDEPTNSMDLNSFELSSRVLNRYLSQNRCLLILVSHQMQLIRLLTDEVLFLDQGKLSARGPTKNMLDHPAHEVLKRFLHHQLTDLQ